ncbi:hypothetical protein L6452_00467 [Arctium lappa]|uniref:Uncharacterized protein n=1 Tax=Arctium lappa TaxID=4217 RepID=A0ACB9FET6_ARCLA|nr:hypothetical protein L6452_00467 [Arctium lappa]
MHHRSRVKSHNFPEQPRANFNCQLKGLNMTGVLPEEFADLTFLQEITLMGNRITGSIPREIGDISTLEELVLSGNNFIGTIPVLFGNLINIQEFRIDGNTLSGRIPDFIGNWTNVTKLMISDLAGSSSMRFPNLQKMTGMRRLTLRNCLLTGPIPEYIGQMLILKNLDLSFNRLNGPIPNQIEGVHLDTMFLNNNSLSGEIREWIFMKNTDAKMNVVSSLSSSASASNNTWAYSTNGVFLENEDAPFFATTMNVRGGDIYGTARLSPASLRYYGLCLRKGSYKVRLHFAEIGYSDDMTFGSLGRRYFDIYVQGVRRRKDFNIMEEANGVGRGIFIDVDDVMVNGSTLEIHLYWAGKGTTFMPHRGVYGPLISAIAITPRLSAGALAGIVIGSGTVIMLILALLWKKGYLGGDKEDKELRALELQTGYFSLRQIKSATHNFDSANKIGEGGFGPVYKGVLKDGSEIAVKQLSARSKQGNREFVTEIGMISGSEEQKLNLDWPTRKKICMGIARGLAYLHEESRLKIVHRDVKATNVLLDRDLNAKISDFGLAKLDEEENTHISTRIAGTIFGVVALEIVSGKSNTKYRRKEEFVYLLDWAYVLEEQGSLLELVDPSLGPKYPKEEAMMMLNLALLCTNPSPTLRPLMSSVVKMLDGKIPVQSPMVKRGAGNPDVMFKAFDMVPQDSQTQVSTISTDSLGPRSLSTDGPSVDSSLYKDDEISEMKLLTDLYDIDI